MPLSAALFAHPLRAMAPLAAFWLATGTAIAAPLPVVATTSVLRDLVDQVGGDLVASRSLVGPDSDAHVFEPTPADAQAVAGAKLIVMNGLGLEGWLTRLLEAAHYGGAKVIASDGVKPLSMDNEDAKPGQPKRITDPHAWQNLANGRIYAANIEKALEAADPEHATQYRSNAAAFDKKLADLDQSIRAALTAVPAEKRKVITTHDAFQYYGHAYGVQFIAAIGVSTEEGEPSAGALAKLEKQIKHDKIKALFLENVTSGRLVEQIAKDTGAVVGPALYSDALSKPDEPAPTYIAMFEYNTKTLIAGMQQN